MMVRKKEFIVGAGMLVAFFVVLFIMFAPMDNPQIAIAVFVENIGFGSMVAGPIASFLAEQYITGQISPKRKWLFDQVLNSSSDPLTQSLASSHP